MPDIVGVGVAFNFGQIFQTKSQLCIFGSSQISEDMFEGLLMLSSWVYYVLDDDPHDICKIRLGRHYRVHDTSYCRCEGIFPLSSLSLSVEGESLSDCPIDVSMLKHLSTF